MRILGGRISWRRGKFGSIDCIDQFLLNPSALIPLLSTSLAKVQPVHHVEASITASSKWWAGAFVPRHHEFSLLVEDCHFNLLLFGSLHHLCSSTKQGLAEIDQ